MNKKMSLFGGPIAVSAPNSGRSSPVDSTAPAATAPAATTPTIMTRDRSSTLTQANSQPVYPNRNPHRTNAGPLQRSASAFYSSGTSSLLGDSTPSTPSPFHLFNLPQATRPMFEAMGITTPVESPPVSRYTRRDFVHISPQGDMVLQVVSPVGTTNFTVDSHVLCLASPVFRAMLGPNFKEGHDLRYAEEVEEEYTLPLLDEENIEAFEIILNAIHLQNAKVSDMLQYETLLELSVIVEKYQMYQAITPWIYQWTQGSKPKAMEPGFEGWLFIAWVLRDDAIFTSLSAKLIKNTVKRYDELLTSEGRVFDKNVPQSVLNSISQRREEAVSGILKICHYYYGKYTNWTLPSGSLCGHPDGQFCDTMMLGALMKGFGPAGLLPAEQDKTAAKSVDELLTTIREMEPKVYECIRTRPCAPAPTGLRGQRCTKHGELKDCPGPLFHESCSFLPGLKIEVDHLVSGVRGLDLGEFNSRAII